jgi:RNA recognition motif-containing protein
MSKKLYVGSLSYDTTEETLEAAFSQAGTVESATVIADKETGRARGFGFVEMETDEGAKKAIEMLNNTMLDGRTIIVNEARPRTEGRGGNRHGGGGGGGRRYDNSGYNKRY